MEIKFNLKDAQIFIPLGRKGNLKKLLWDNINLSADDIKSISEKKVQDENLEVTFDGYINDLTKKQDFDITNALEAHKKDVIRPLIESALKKKSKDDVIDLMMASSTILDKKKLNVMTHPEIEKKLMKLNKIKQFNELKGE